MKAKRIISMLLTAAICLSFTGVVFAGEAADFISYKTYKDFTDGSSLSGIYSNHKETIAIYDSETGSFLENFAARGYELTEDGTFKMAGGTDYYTRFLTPKVSPLEKLVFSFDLKTNLSGGKGYCLTTNKNTYGTGVVTFYDDGGIYAYYNKGEKVGSFTAGEWTNVTVVYDNVNPEDGYNRRDIYIDGVYATTAQETTSAGYDYVKLGRVSFSPLFHGKAAHYVEFDNITAYVLPEELDYRILSASGNEISLEFNMIPDIESLEEGCFVITDESGEEAVVSSVALDERNPRIVVIGTEEILKAGEGYTVTAAETITAGASEDDVMGATLSLGENAVKTFETDPYKVYADITVFNQDAEAESLTAGDYNVSCEFVNESDEELSSVLVAAVYGEGNLLEEIYADVCNEGEATATLDFSITEPQGKTLKVFAIKDEANLSPISAIYTFNEEGKAVSGEYDSLKKLYKASPVHSNKVDGDTYKVTTTLEDGESLLGREAVVAVFAENKGLSDIDWESSTEAFIMLDAFTVTSEGHTYAIPDVKGNYPSMVALSNGVLSSEGLVEYFGAEFMNAGLETVKDITEDEVDAFLKDYEKALSIDLSAYNELGEGKVLVAKSVEAQRKEKENKEFAGYDEFFEALSKAIEIAGITTEEAVIARIEKEGETVSVELIDDVLSKAAKKAVYEEILSDMPLTDTEFSGELAKLVILKGNEHAESYTQTQAIIEKTEEITDVDLSVYNTLKNKKAPCVAVSGNSYEDYEALTDAFEKAAKDQKRTENTVTAGGGGGGGGGGKSSSTVNKTPLGEIKIDSTFGKEENNEVKEEIKISFNDLSGYEWASEAINALAKEGTVNGIGEGLFNPGGTVKREEFVKMISGLYTHDEVTAAFEDVNSTAWYAPYIGKAVGAGIINGISDKLFGIGKGVTRQDMAVIICRALKLSEAEAVGSFADDGEISDYAKGAVYALKEKGYISGTDKGTYEPSRVLTRAEAATVIYNVIRASK